MRFLSLMCGSVLLGVVFLSSSFSLKAESEMTEEWVILIPGLLRSPKTMQPIAKALKKRGYHTVIVDYSSRKKTIREIADKEVADAVSVCRKKGAKKIHFVTHSLGGILVRDYLSRKKLSQLGRVVMLAPPNQGSELVDKMGYWKVFQWLNGPAGVDLGTDKKSAPKALGGVKYPVGIIAGDRSINWINSCMIPGPDDGKVSVENTKLKGMTDHVVIHRTHPMIMKRKETIDLVLKFLQKGKF